MKEEERGAGRRSKGVSEERECSYKKEWRKEGEVWCERRGEEKNKMRERKEKKKKSIIVISSILSTRTSCFVKLFIKTVST